MRKRQTRINEGIFDKLRRAFKPLGRNDRDMGRDAEWSKLAIKNSINGDPNYMTHEDDLGWYYDPDNTDREKYLTFDENGDDEDILDSVRIHDNDDFGNYLDKGIKIKDSNPEQLRDIENGLRNNALKDKDYLLNHYNDKYEEGNHNFADEPMNWYDYDRAERERDEKPEISEGQLYRMINESIRRNLRMMF